MLLHPCFTGRRRIVLFFIVTIPWIVSFMLLLAIGRNVITITFAGVTSLLYIVENLLILFHDAITFEVSHPVNIDEHRVRELIREEFRAIALSPKADEH